MGAEFLVNSALFCIFIFFPPEPVTPMCVPDSFLSYKHLKGKLRVFLTGKTVAIVTSDVMKMTTTY